MIPNLSNPKITYKLSLFCMNNSLDLVSLNISCNGMTKDYFFFKKKRKSKPKYFHQLKITNSNNFFYCPNRVVNLFMQIIFIVYYF